MCVMFQCVLAVSVEATMFIHKYRSALGIHQILKTEMIL